MLVSFQHFGVWIPDKTLFLVFGISLVDVWISDETFLVFDTSLLGVWILDKTFLLVSDIPKHPGLFLVHSLDYVIIRRT